MTRLTVLLVLGGAGVLCTAAPAPAQWGYGGMPFGRPYGFGHVPVIVPSFNPFYYVPQYNYWSGSSLNFNSPYGRFNLGTYQWYSGINNPYTTAWALNQFQYQAPYAQSGSYPSAQGGSYMTAGAYVRNDLVLAAQRDLAQAQREASMPGAKSQISGQGDYEKGGAAAQPGALPAQDPLRSAIVAPDPDQIVSGDALNQILQEIIRVEAKGAKGPSAFIPPLLMDDIRFGGSPAADLLNLARQGGNLHLPLAFDDPALVGLSTDLEKDFAAVAVAVQAGKSPDAAKIAKLEATFQKIQDIAPAVIKDLPFDDASAARRFLNRMAGAIKALKSGAANGLIDPKWAAEGLTVAELVKHMTRHKLLFGPAPRGRDEAYSTLHRNLVTYLFVLTQPKK